MVRVAYCDSRQLLTLVSKWLRNQEGLKMVKYISFFMYNEVLAFRLPIELAGLKSIETGNKFLFPKD